MRLWIAVFIACVTIVGCSKKPSVTSSNFSDPNESRKRLFLIDVYSQDIDGKLPGSTVELSRANGTGFLIGDNKILTNAHVVGNSRVVWVKPEGSSKKYRAKVLFIADYCDLALVAIDEDHSELLGITPLPLSKKVPRLHDPVVVYGYPIGGETLSVTSGNVARIEVQNYVWSSVDKHLIVQLDIPINAGNSGGPVLSQGEVIGVAFAGSTIAENTGYVIPISVVRHFLKDLEDNVYDGYVNLPFTYQALHSLPFRFALGLKEQSQQGVMVSTVYKSSSADGLLMTEDVLLSIDGQKIRNDGTVSLQDDPGTLVNLDVLMDEKFPGDQVLFEVLRKGKKIIVPIRLEPFWPIHSQSSTHDQKSHYVMQSGMVFSPLSKKICDQRLNADMRYYCSHFISDEIYESRPQPVALTNVLDDPLNQSAKAFLNFFVESINGNPILTLHDVAKSFAEKKPFYLIKFSHRDAPLLFSENDLREAHQRILATWTHLDAQSLESSPSLPRFKKGK